jgi:hypothetical protein
VFRQRAIGFVTGWFTLGFTSRYACPPGRCRHLTLGL